MATFNNNFKVKNGLDAVGEISTLGNLYANKTTYGFSVVSSAPASITYWKIATLPATNAGTYDHIVLDAILDDNWGSAQKVNAKILFSNRDAFTFRYYLNGTVRSASRILAYTEANGTVSIYLRAGNGNFCTMSYNITHGVDAGTTIHKNPTSTTTTPTGTLVFDSSNTGTYVPQMYIPYSGTPQIQGNSLAYLASPTFTGTLTTPALTISGGGTYGAGSIYSDSNWGMLFRARTVSPTNAQFRWANSADGELMRLDNSGRLIVSNSFSGSTQGTAQIEARTVNATTIGSIVRGFGTGGSYTQTADLQQWQSFNGTTPTTLAKIDSIGNFTIGANLTFTNPGVGNETKINFTKTNDQAWLGVTERTGDSTTYEFGMADNPDGGDYFQWRFNDWQNPATGWMPIQITANTNRFIARTTSMFGNMQLPYNSGFFTYNNTATATDNEVNKFTPTNSTTQQVAKDAGTGTGTLTVNATGFTGTGATPYWIVIDGTGTFKWGTGSYQFSTPGGTGVAITGSAQTLSNGLTVTLSTTGHVLNDRWSFSAYPTPQFSIGSGALGSVTSTISTRANFIGQVIRGASGQTADMFEIQNNSGAELLSINSTGSMLLGNTGIAADTYVSFIGAGSNKNAGIRWGADSAGSDQFNLTSNTTDGDLTLNILGATRTFNIKAAASQSSNILEIQNSSASVLTSVTSAGNLNTGQIRSGTTSGLAQITAITGSASTIGAIIRRSTSQTANLLEFQLENGNIMSRIDASGDAYFGLINSSYSTSITAGGAAIVPLTVKGAASQTANLQSWQNSSSQERAYVTADGSILTAATLTTMGNLRVAGTAATGGGSGVIGIANAGTAPTSNPTGGGVLFVNAGALQYRGTSGSAATIVNADGTMAGGGGYTLPTATSTALGGVELFSDTQQSVAANAVTDTASRTYGIQLNSNLQAVVNVPWTDTVYTSPLTLTSLSTGFSIAGGTTSKTLTVNRTLTLTGTDSTTMTFPSTNATIARTDAAQTFTGTQTFSSSIDTPGISRTGANSITISTANSSGNGSDISINGGTSSGNGGNIVITAGDSSSFTGGNVTINAGNGNTDGSIYIGTTSGTNQYLYLGTSSSYTFIPGALDIAGGAGIGASGVTISTSGNIDADGALTVGGGYGSSGVTVTSVGTISANGNIVVDGNGTFGNLAGTGTRNVNSTSAGVLTNATSSARYKQDISDAEYVYEDILKLQPKTFKLKSEVEELENPITYAGFIAEDVDEIDSLKVFVGYSRTPDGELIPDSLYYAEMVSALVSALKHQDTIIKSLETRIQALESN